MKRRTFIQKSSLAAISAGPITESMGSNRQKDFPIEILNPMDRVPVSFIIDDSTALVNMAYFGIPQFAEVFPDRYKQDWRKLPREIPDSFVAEFIEWCDQHGVKGKYSMVPYPACTGWLHRFIPGWTKDELKNSLDLVRNDVTPNWDIHSEMISHTRVIDIKTGQPYPYPTPDYMENWEWSQERSRDELAAYISYSLKILKDTGYYCDGVTTPGGFGHRNIPNLAAATMDGVIEHFGADVSHFFRDVITDKEKSVAPVVVHHENIASANPVCSVHIIGCTGDWFGGWDGLNPGDQDRFITRDLSEGRMVEVIDSGDPACMVCHWPGIYYNGEKIGFNIFKTAVERLEEKYGSSIQWMKLTDIARYWAAKEFVYIEEQEEGISIDAPFRTKNFTARIGMRFRRPILHFDNQQVRLLEVSPEAHFEPNSFKKDKKGIVACFDLSARQSWIKEA